MTLVLTWYNKGYNGMLMTMKMRFTVKIIYSFPKRDLFRKNQFARPKKS